MSVEEAQHELEQRIIKIKMHELLSEAMTSVIEKLAAVEGGPEKLVQELVEIYSKGGEASRIEHVVLALMLNVFYIHILMKDAPGLTNADVNKVFKESLLELVEVMLNRSLPESTAAEASVDKLKNDLWEDFS